MFVFNFIYSLLVRYTVLYINVLNNNNINNNNNNFFPNGTHTRYTDKDNHILWWKLLQNDANVSMLE